MAAMIAQSQDPRLRFEGHWIKDSDEGLRELFVWCGMPWLLSFVVMRKISTDMNIHVSFPDGPDGAVELATPEQQEILPMDGSSVKILQKKPFEREVTVDIRWLVDNDDTEPRMRMRREDLTLGGPKKYPTISTITRRLVDDGNAMESTLVVTRLDINVDKQAIIRFKRQPSK